MKKIILILLIFLSINSCEKTESPCDIYDKDYSVNFAVKTSPDFHMPPDKVYRYDSMYLFHKDTLYPFIINDYASFNLKLPPNQEVKDTFYLDWWNVPDRDTVVLEFKLSDKPCKTFEYEHAWFNGEYFKEFGNNFIQTFEFTKK